MQPRFLIGQALDKHRMKGMDPVLTVDGLKEEVADGYSWAVASRSRRAVLTCIISSCAGTQAT